MGRKPLPTELKKKKGTFRKNQSNPNEPKTEKGIPDPPEYLSGFALKFWHDITPELFKVGVLCKTDKHALAALCIAYKRWRQAELELESESLTDKTSNGNIIQHALVGTANRAMELLHKMMSEFGLTPASRSKIIATSKDEGKNNPWAGM